MSTPQTEVIASLDGRELFRAALPPGEYVIGREVNMPIRLHSDRVSRRHAQLTLNYYNWEIEDFGSANGTFLAGTRLLPNERVLVFPSQHLSVGNVRVQLRRLPDAAPDSDAEFLPPATAAVRRYLPEPLRSQHRYLVKNLIAMGGMGAVLEAEDLSTRRSVAMKVLADLKSPEHVARFIEEAQITAQLEHPNIVPIYELNVNELDQPFYVMKLVRGESLKQVLSALRREKPEAQEKYPLSELLTILLSVCDAVAYAHSKGVVHRDLKPDNIMLGVFGETLVMDWGLAKPLGQSANADSRGSVRTMVSSLRDEDEGVRTVVGSALGTPQFMSPEQAAGLSHTVDGRADVYALGAILYNILTLQPPFDGNDAHDTLIKVVSGQVTPPHEAVAGRNLAHLKEGRLPEPLVKIALKAMSVAIDDRYATVRDLQAEIRAFQFGEKKRPSRFDLAQLFGGKSTPPKGLRPEH